MTNIVRGGHVPIIFSYRRVTKRPEIKRTKRFIGWKRIVGTLLHRALEWVEELAYSEGSEVMEAGREESVHWALQVDDPWGPNDTSQLVVTRVPEHFKGGMNFEMIKIEEPREDDDVVRVGPARRPANFETARSRMRDMLQREAHYAGGEQQQQPQPPLGCAPDHLATPQVSPPFHGDNNGRS